MQPVSIVWLKRDIRLTDHAPLQKAIEANYPVLLLYLFEPNLIHQPDCSPRHWNFVVESLLDIHKKLPENALFVAELNALDAFKKLSHSYSIQGVYSHQEIGIQATFTRDKQLKNWFKKQYIPWHEFQCNGVIRGLQNRNNWAQQWLAFMEQPQLNPILNELKTIAIPTEISHEFYSITNFKNSFRVDPHPMQPGGESLAWKYLKSFLTERHYKYNKGISKPELSRTACSRISPYLSWGNISMRSVYQFTKSYYASSKSKRNLQAFISRLHWHCHFIQKFESECRIEFEYLNKSFIPILQKTRNEAFIRAWKTGNTGYPIVDACMRCVNATGYLNFRMRAMLVSFYSNNLWQPWREGALHLAQQFLDYEPGIHYPQFQMQTGVWGVNTIRMYNPVKQSYDHDPKGTFIKKWIPELANLAEQLVHEPHKITPIEQQLYNFTPGEAYPLPIVDFESTAKFARETLHNHLKTEACRIENFRILKKHVKLKQQKGTQHLTD